MLNEEEIINKIKNTKNLSEKISKIIYFLDSEIDFLKNPYKPVKWSSQGNEYKEMINDLWELKDSCVTFLNEIEVKKRQRDLKNEIIAKKVIEQWSIIKNKIDILNKLIISYNKKFPKNQLKTLEELTGLKIKPAVKTKYFNY